MRLGIVWLVTLVLAVVAPLAQTRPSETLDI
jgi:hypothetical protein